MACDNPNHATSCFLFITFRGCKKIPKLIFWFEILSNTSPHSLDIIKELLDTLALQHGKVEVENSAKPCHFPYKRIRNCAKTSVPTTVFWQKSDWS